MGLYYKLSNGEEIEIVIEETEDYINKLKIKLFGGSTILEYELNKIIILNDIIAEVEKDYNKLLQEDLDFEYRCWCD